VGSEGDGGVGVIGNVEVGLAVAVGSSVRVGETVGSTIDGGVCAALTDDFGPSVIISPTTSNTTTSIAQ